MELRSHPLMSYHRVPNWPPAWYWIGGDENDHPNGEVGVLRGVETSQIAQADRCFLIMEYEQSRYMGALLFSDTSFCGFIAKLLEGHCGEPIKTIGDLDLSHTL
jgi:hypothetical protein